MLKNTIQDEKIPKNRQSRTVNLIDSNRENRAVSFAMAGLYCLLALIAAASFCGSTIQKMSFNYLTHTNSSLPPPEYGSQTITVSTSPGN